MISRVLPTKRIAIAVIALSAASFVPGAAVASHTPQIDHHTCDPATATGCPAFEVNMLVGVQNPIADGPSSVHFQYSQPDRRMPVMRAEYLIPKGWRFGGLSTIDPALNDANAPPANCNDQVYNANGSIRRAEALSPDTGMRVRAGASRGNPDDLAELDHAATNTGLFEPFDAQYDYGYRNPGSSEGSRNPSVVLLDWDGTTARLCYYHRNNVINGDAAGPTELIKSATLTKLAADPSFDWKLSLDNSAIYKDADFKAEQGSVLKHDFGFAELTAGNWNTHPVTGLNTGVNFSRTPSIPGTYTFRGTFSTCSGGLDSAAASGCKDIGAAGDAGDFTSKTIDQLVDFVDPGSNLRHDFGILSGPKTPDLCFNATCPMGLLFGQSSFNATWNEPALPGGVQVKGYVLTIAEPGNQASRVFRRIITNPNFATDPDYNASACTGGACQLPLSFPMQSSDGSTALFGDTKYHLALVTMYTDSNRRSDGTCDNPTGTSEGARGAGAVCPANEPRIRVTDPGISTWQVLMRPDEWPNVYIERFDDNSNGTADKVTNRLMLVNFETKRAEFIIWNTNDKVSIFSATSNLIVGDDGMGLTAFTGSLSSAAKNWAVVGVMTPDLAVGTFLNFDLKNPGIAPPTISGVPTVSSIGLCSDLTGTLLLTDAYDPFGIFGIGHLYQPVGECITYGMVPLL